VARTLAQKLGASMGQQFIVENKPGASGNIGTEQVVYAAHDGYTLAILPDSNLTVNPSLFPSMKFVPQRDLMPVVILATNTIALVCNPSVPAKNLSELLAYAKGLPGALSFGSPGSGSSHHLAGERLQQQSGVNTVHVPYKGGSAAVLDVVGNQIPCAFVALGIAAPHVKAGKLSLIGVTQSARSTEFPDAPTIGETIEGFEVTSWIGLFAPAGTPNDVVDTLNAQARMALGDPATAKTLAAQSLDVMLSSPAE
jgi:tripartite-type tricarboxylate transporter receptor subunit TctC